MSAKRKNASGLLGLLIAVLAVSCSPSQTEQSAAGRTGPDPTLVDAGHYKTEFENERVRIVRVVYRPGEESVMHYHPDSVAVFLNERHVEFRTPDGSTTELHAEAGRHAFVPAGLHLPRNIGDEPWELLLVELQPEGPRAAPAAGETGPDPTVVDARHYRTEFENERVRIVRIAYAPGEESVLHYHPDSVAAFLTEQHTEFRATDGSTIEAHTEAGKHAFATAGLHIPRNIGDEPLELVLVELR